MRITPCLLAAFACVLFAGCATTDDPTIPKGKFWQLGSALDQPPGDIQIFEGASQAEVKQFLGEPREKKTKASDPAFEEWVYQRRVNFGYGVRSAYTQGASVMVASKQRYLETARIEFQNGAVTRIYINRIREDLDVSSPFQRSLSDN